MIEPKDVAAEALTLIQVATSEWLAGRATAEATANHLRLEHTKRAQRLRLLEHDYQRLGEIDARIALIEATPELPSQQELVQRLREIRTALVRKARSR